MFFGNGGFTFQVFSLHIDTGHFGGKVFSLYANCGKKVGQRSALRHPKAMFHHVGTQVEKCLVAFGADYGKSLVVHASFIQNTRKFALGFLQFSTRFYALHFQQSLLDEFGAAGLYREIGLGKGNLRFSWVSILGYKIASVTGEHNVIYLTLSAFPCNYHLIDVNKMIADFLPNILARFFCFGNYFTEVLPEAITQQSA